MARSIAVLTVAAALLLGFRITIPQTALADANGRASCVGLEASSVNPPGTSDEFPGGQSQVTKAIKAQAAEAGVSPGALYSPFARLHEGSHEACDAAVG